MPTQELVSQMIGHWVIAQKEGAQLGAVSHVHIDVKRNKISALSFKAGVMGETFWVAAKNIKLIGKDVVLISSETLINAPSSEEKPSGVSLKELSGFLVATAEGRHLGKLKDLEVQGKNWVVCGLCMEGGKKLSLDPSEMTVGPDQIVVPKEHAERIIEETTPEEQSALGRFFSSASTQAQEVATNVKKSFAANKANSDKEEYELEDGMIHETPLDNSGKPEKVENS